MKLRINERIDIDCRSISSSFIDVRGIIEALGFTYDNETGLYFIQSSRKGTVYIVDYDSESVLYIIYYSGCDIITFQTFVLGSDDFGGIQDLLDHVTTRGQHFYLKYKPNGDIYATDFRTDKPDNMDGYDDIYVNGSKIKLSESNKLRFVRDLVSHIE